MGAGLRSGAKMTPSDANAGTPVHDSTKLVQVNLTVPLGPDTMFPNMWPGKNEK